MSLLHQLKELMSSQLVVRIPEVLSNSSCFLFTPNLSAANAAIFEFTPLHAFLKVHAFAMEPLVAFPITLDHKRVLIKHAFSANTVGKRILNFQHLKGYFFRVLNLFQLWLYFFLFPLRLACDSSVSVVSIIIWISLSFLLRLLAKSVVIYESHFFIIIERIHFAFSLATGVLYLFLLLIILSFMILQLLLLFHLDYIQQIFRVSGLQLHIDDRNRFYDWICHTFPAFNILNSDLGDENLSYKKGYAWSLAFKTEQVLITWLFLLFKLSIFSCKFVYFRKDIFEFNYILKRKLEFVSMVELDYK